MEPIWEYKWVVWDEVKACFVPTPIWLTDAEARGDWYAKEMCVYRLEHTKRDRMHVAGICLDPPAPELPWCRERYLHSERRRDGLTAFVTPFDEESCCI